VGRSLSTALAGFIVSEGHGKITSVTLHHDEQCPHVRTRKKRRWYEQLWMSGLQCLYKYLGGSLRWGMANGAWQDKKKMCSSWVTMFQLETQKSFENSKFEPGFPGFYQCVLVSWQYIWSTTCILIPDPSSLRGRPGTSMINAIQRKEFIGEVPTHRLGAIPGANRSVGVWQPWECTAQILKAGSIIEQEHEQLWSEIQCMFAQGHCSKPVTETGRYAEKRPLLGDVGYLQGQLWIDDSPVALPHSS
jgi:hypothetical protein